MNETIHGRVLRVVFAADGGEFAVLRLAVDGRAEPVAAIGPLGGAVPGEQLALEGEWEKHATHGEQFRAQRVVAEVPTSREGVARYLAGLRGIGPTLADRLVDAFGEKAIEVLEHETWRAAQIKGVGKRRAGQAAEDAAARSQERAVMVYLQGLGVSPAYAARIRKTYGSAAIDKLKENPYLLARDVRGIGFHTADQIARKLGIGADAPERLDAGLLFVVGNFGDEGHTFAPRPALLERAAALLDIDAVVLDPRIDNLARSGYLVIDDEAVFPTPMYRTEQELAMRIARLLHAERPAAPPEVVDVELTAEQRGAVAACGSAGVVVITGGPGTGKTTVVRTIVATWTAARRRVRLAAPTGRAAKRLSEASGQPALTLHRLLEWGRGGSGASFGRGLDHPLELDLLVVDEASMLDTQLARALLRAVPLGATLVLVGDVDQLPSVGAGQVLADLIASRAVPVTRLSRIFRQAEGSAIVENAHRILAGELPVSNPRGEEQAPGALFVVQADDPERARDLVVRMCKERIPQAYGLDPVRDVQVLVPMHRGPAGTEELNRALQAELNPHGRELKRAGSALRVGDKVMQSRNDYERDVFNGDIGVVVTVGSTGQGSDDDIVEVSFDGRIVEYDGDSAAGLELAYAVTVHKSQGSEYPAVVIPILFQHYPLLKRNLLYTAVTRGKRLVVLVGSPRAMRRAVEVTGVDERHTRLAQRLGALGAKLEPDA